MKYDYLFIGSGLFSSVIAHELSKIGKKVLIWEKRNHIGGNVYTEKSHGINVHKYGPHIFHCNNQKIWDYINRFAKFNNFTNRPKVSYKDKIYSFPINMMTFYQLWGTQHPNEVIKKLNSVKIKCEDADNAEDWMLSQVGREVYETFIQGYTKKQWGKDPRELPASIVKRVPIRLTYDDNYFNDRYQGIPIGGYTQIIENMLNGIDVEVDKKFTSKEEWKKYADKLIYTGPIDEFFDYEYGPLEYRSLRFVELLANGDQQGNAIINYTDENILHTRIVEHKHFEFGRQEKTVLTFEYPENWTKNKEPYYPVNDHKNNELYAKYKKKSGSLKDVIFGGRLGSYAYYDMDKTIENALKYVDEIKSVL